MKDKFKELTASEKFAVRESLFTSMADSTNTPEYGSRAVEEFEHTENSRSEMEDINMFQQVWKMPDDEEEDNEEPVIPMPRAGSISEDLDALDSLPKPKMDFEDNAPNALKTFDKQPARKPKLDSMMSKRSAENCWAQVDMGDDDDGFLPTTPESTNISIYEDHDFLKEVVPSGAKLSYTKPNYNAHEFSDSSTGSAHMDDDDFPLTAGADKKLLKNSGSAPMPKESQPMNSMMNTAHIQSFDQSSISDKKFDSSRSNSQKQVMRDYNDNLLPEVAEDREKSQYVHGSTAVVPWPDEDFNDSGSDTSPIRPHSIANQHKHQSNIAIPSEHYTFPDESEQSDSDESDAMVRKKDFRELSSMIEEDDLAALTTKASLLADSLKTKLVDSEIADLSSETEDDKKTTVGNLYGGFGQPKSREASFQQGLSDLELSRIGSENGDRNFVEVSDSILASPARTNGLELPTGGLPMSGTSPDNSNQSGSSSSGFVARAPSGESSGGKDVTHPGAMVNSDYFPHEADEGHVTQKAGEPSQGERRQDRLGVAPRVAAYAEHDVADSTSRRYNNPPQNISQRKPVLFPTSAEAKTTMFKTDDLPPPRSAEKDISGVNTSYSISDWSAVGVTASVLADWSDSCSTSSYGDSVSSMEATTRPSALSTPFANEIDNLVAQFDFDGVKLAAEKYETSMDEHQKVIDEKRRKKRELESWRTSISKTFSK